MQGGAGAPILSVLIPTWNRVGPVVSAVQSVGDQSAAVEIIVVDNGSEDALFRELAAALATFPAVRLFRNEQNIGMVRNWNRCMTHARGVWQGLLCSDDRYHPGAVERALPILASLPEPALVVQDPTIGDAVQYLPAGESTVRGLRLPIASGNFWHRQVVERLGPFDERFEYSADAEYWYRIACSFPVVKVAEPFAVYEQHETNYMWQTWRKADYLEQTELLARTVAGHMFHGHPAAEERIDREVEQRIWSTLMTIIENTFLHAGRGDICARYLAVAWQRAGTMQRRKEIALRLLYAVKHRLDAALGRGQRKEGKG